jgi:hypothetical protein
MQLSKLKFSKDVKTTLKLANDMLVIQKHIVKLIITLLRTTFKKEFG